MDPSWTDLTGGRISKPKDRPLKHRTYAPDGDDWNDQSYEALARAAPTCPEALGALLERLRPLLLDFARSKGVGERADAEDLVQQTLIRVMEHIDRYDPSRAKVTTWVSTILLRLLSNDRRNSQLRATRTSEYGDQVIAEMRARARRQESRPDAEAEARMLEERVRASIRTLGAVYQDVVTLALQGYTQNEIAEACDLEVGTVKSRKHRGLQKLAEIMAD